MKIRSKLQIVAALPVAVFILMASARYVISDIIEKEHAKADICSSIMKVTTILTALTYEYGALSTDRSWIQLSGQYEALDVMMKDADKKFKGPEERPLFDAIRLAAKEARERSSGLRGFDLDDRRDEMSLQLRRNMLNSLILRLNDIMPIAEDLYAVRLSHIGQFMSYENALTSVLVLLIVLIVPSIAIFLIGGITTPIDRLQQDMKMLASGDLDHRTAVASEDEIGYLARGFNDMAGKLMEITVSREELLLEIAERRKIEESLKESEARLKEAQKLAHLGHWDLDLVNNTLHWSDEVYRIFGLLPQEFGATYEAFLEMVHPEDRDLVNRAYTDSVKNRTGYDIEHRVLLKNGEIRHVNERCVTLYTPDGKPLRSLGTVLDITERKRAEDEFRRLNETLEKRVEERTAELQQKGERLKATQQALVNVLEDINNKTKELGEANIKLQDLDRLKSMFIATMSHELRTPLNSIIGFSSILHDGWAGPLNDDQKNRLATVLRAGKHLLALINDVIDVSKIESGRIEVSYEDFDVYDVMTEAVELFKKDLTDKGLDLQVEPVHLAMHTDRRRLLQSVVNLISNAMKFTERGSIRVQACIIGSSTKGQAAREDKEAGSSSKGQGPEKQGQAPRIKGRMEEDVSLLRAACPLPLTGDFVEISVSDTGIGIKEEDMPRLFGAFVRLASPEGKTIKGTGLGLYLTKKIIADILKGEISAESEYGKGSRFAIRIPIQCE